MAIFIIVTRWPDGARVVVNTDRVEFMVRQTGNSTGIVFGDNGVIPSILCDETPAQILELIREQDDR